MSDWKLATVTEMGKKSSNVLPRGGRQVSWQIPLHPIPSTLWPFSIVDQLAAILDFTVFTRLRHDDSMKSDVSMLWEKGTEVDRINNAGGFLN